MTEIELKQRLERIRCFVLDLEGTVLLGDHLLDFVPEFLAKVKEVEKEVIFMTNNTARSPQAHLARLRQLGLQVKDEQLYTAADATAEYLLNFGPGHRLCILGTEDLVRFFEAKGFVNEPDNPDAVVLGTDLDFDYGRLNHATRLLLDGVQFFATHPDTTFPVDEDESLPDCGALTAALRVATGIEPIVLGLPNVAMVDGLLQRAGVGSDELAIIGDRLDTDVRAAIDNDILAILTLTGETHLEQIASADPKPDYVIATLRDVLRLLK